MIDGFRLLARTLSIAAGKSLNPRPVRQQPGFEFVLGGMGMEARFVANPGAHGGPGVQPGGEFPRLGAGVDISQGNDMVVDREKPHDLPFQGVTLGNTAVGWVET